MAYHIVIPARYASSRLPGKPLLDIGGKPLVQHVYEKAVASEAKSVAIATDDEKIIVACKKFSAPVFMTSNLHQSGTDRIAELASTLDYADDDVIINLQGDEPLMSPIIVKKLGLKLQKLTDVDCATIATQIDNTADIFNPNVVKVILDKHNFASYFTRAPAPWYRGEFDKGEGAVISSTEQKYYLRHLGIYAYRVKLLKQYASLKPAPTENLEQLEQLRLIWHGIKIYVAQVETATAQGVDTAEDLLKVRAIFNEINTGVSS